MSARVVWNGLDLLLDEIRALPQWSTTEGLNAARKASNAAAVDIKSEYGRHRVTGALQDRVTVEDMPTGRFGVRRRVRNSAPHSHLFEFGTAKRTTEAGANRGEMPEARPHVFVPRILHWRKQMYQELIAAMYRAGASRVTGSA